MDIYNQHSHHTRFCGKGNLSLQRLTENVKGADLSSLVLCSLNLSLYSEGWSIFLGIKLRSAPTKSYKIVSIQESGILFAKAKAGAQSTVVFCYCIRNYQNLMVSNKFFYYFKFFMG